MSKHFSRQTHIRTSKVKDGLSNPVKDQPTPCKNGESIEKLLEKLHNVAFQSHEILNVMRFLVNFLLVKSQSIEYELFFQRTWSQSLQSRSPFSGQSGIWIKDLTFQSDSN